MSSSKKIITNDSSGIQADGDITINVGLTFTQVEQLTKLFLEQNFPKLREDAMKTAQDNVTALLKEFEKQLQEKFESINPLKFSDPDVQSSINDAVMEAAKRGNKSNLELLVNLIFKRVQKKDNDLQSLTASEAIKIISQLSQNQINLLSLEYLLYYLPRYCSEFGMPDEYYSNSLPMLKEIDITNDWDIQHLVMNRCLILTKYYDFNFNVLKRGYRQEQERERRYQRFWEKNCDKPILRQIELFHLGRSLSRCQLTTIGILIGGINLGKYIPESLDSIDVIQ